MTRLQAVNSKSFHLGDHLCRLRGLYIQTETLLMFE